MEKYQEYFGLSKEPFLSSIATKDLMTLPSTNSVKMRLDYLLKIGGIMIVTGEVGSGKSTALRWALSTYHPSEVKSIPIVANTGSINELYKLLAWSLDLDIRATSKSLLVRSLKEQLLEISKTNRQKILISVDEASLLRIDVYAELHTLTQFNFDSQNVFSLVLAGQKDLLDKLSYRPVLPLASRVISKVHLEPLNRDQIGDYVAHHLKIAGMKKKIFGDDAITAIHQGSGGTLRFANHLARGGLIACMIDRQDLVTAEHIRIASTELMI